MKTPALIYSEPIIAKAVCRLRNAVGNNARILYSTKACALDAVIQILHPLVDGFAVASINEARLVSRITESASEVHITTPGLRPEWFLDDVLWSYVAFNSISQFSRMGSLIRDETSVGLRINPGYSPTEDQRYNTCRSHSKLGVSLDRLRDWLPQNVRSINGFHVHNACLAEDWTPLLETVKRIATTLDASLRSVEWINLGGGYLWDQQADFAPLLDAIDMLQETYGLQVFLEPGAGIINAAGSLVSSVIDIFESDGKRVAVLDTTVNHLPEVFEYQFEPDVAQHVEGAPHDYILAGCSCLAGDVFGMYTFRKPLEIGSQITFTNVGAYTLAKAHTFNGISLPSIYVLDENDEPALIREFTFDDFAAGCGSDIYKHADI